MGRDAFQQTRLLKALFCLALDYYTPYTPDFGTLVLQHATCFIEVESFCVTFVTLGNVYHPP